MNSKIFMNLKELSKRKIELFNAIILLIVFSILTAVCVDIVLGKAIDMNGDYKITYYLSSLLSMVFVSLFVGSILKIQEINAERLLTSKIYFKNKYFYLKSSNKKLEEENAIYREKEHERLREVKYEENIKTILKREYGKQLKNKDEEIKVLKNHIDDIASTFEELKNEYDNIYGEYEELYKTKNIKKLSVTPNKLSDEKIRVLQ